jgi:serine/threonine protein kinase HipA of HipAB toxin-antitoxin module
MRQMTLDIHPPHPTNVTGNLQLAVGLARGRKRRAQGPQHRRRRDQRQSAKAALGKATINALCNPLGEPVAAQGARAGVRRYRVPRATHTFE